LILFNLLDNAIKYTGRGGRVTVFVETANTEAVLRVRDTGVGIAPEVAWRSSRGVQWRPSVR
jgi:signal transduction histidine kinase